MKVETIDPVALVRWLAVTADLHGVPVKWSDKLIAAAKHDAQNPTGTVNVLVVERREQEIKQWEGVA